MLDCLNQNRRLDGLPPVKKLRLESVRAHQSLPTSSTTEAAPVPSVTSDANFCFQDEMLMVDELDTEDTIYLAAGRAPTIVEKHLSVEEREAFNNAKDEALLPWLENCAFEAADRSEAAEGEVCPMRYLLKYKIKAGEKLANARIIIQGFHLHDVNSERVEKESPTLSRLGRNIILMYCATKGWKLFSADVKSAFLQSDDIVETYGLRIFGEPSADMRRRLERMMSLQPHQILRMRKPAFGDVRAPRQWYVTADKSLQERQFYQHPLDRCL